MEEECDSPCNAKHPLDVFKHQSIRPIQLRYEAHTLDSSQTLHNVIVLGVIRDIRHSAAVRGALVLAFARSKRGLALLEVLSDLAEDELKNVLQHMEV
jgi:hypothetical protein